MASFKALSLAGMMALATGTAFGADLLPPPPPFDPGPAPVSDFSGWYLRADVGVGTFNDPKLSNPPDPLTQGAGSYVPTSYTLSNGTLGSTTFIALGVGYQLNSWFRADLTGEYRGRTGFEAHDQLLSTNTDSTGFVVNNVLRNFYRGEVSSLVGLINGYVDLGTWYGLTPYVGAGVGFAQNRTSGFTDQGYNNATSAATGAFLGSSSTGGYYAKANKMNFAWALMAGVAWDVNERLKLEVGYRYLSLGKAKAGSPYCYGADGGEQNPPCVNVLTVSDRMSAQDIKLGVRWLLTAPEHHQAPVFDPGQAPPQQRIVRKY